MLSLIPAVSEKVHARPFISILAWTMSRVVPCIGDTIETYFLQIAFIKVDFPALVFPTIATDMPLDNDLC